MVSITGWTYSAADGLGSVRQRLDGSGGIDEEFSYRPFGSPLQGDGGDPYGFTGEAWDAEAGLLYLRARYYDPRTGRFLSQDPWSGSTLRPGMLHGFTYLENDPINGADPSGMCPPGVPECRDEQGLPIDPYYLSCNPHDAACLARKYPSPKNPETFEQIYDCGDECSLGGVWSFTTQRAVPYAFGGILEAIDRQLLGIPSSVFPWLLNVENSAFQLGRLGGRAVSDALATLELLVGCGLQSGGLAIAGTGYGVLAGVPASAIGVVLVAHGSAVLIQPRPQIYFAETGKESSDSENHHIISDKSTKYDFKNHPAIRESGFDIEKDPDNLVTLPGHRGRHTNRYHDIIQERLDNVYRDFGGTPKLETKIREMLRDLRGDLLSGKLDPYMK
jgi:RHS repeat-associated protein